jgi:hypothetical protein
VNGVSLASAIHVDSCSIVKSLSGTVWVNRVLDEALFYFFPYSRDRPCNRHYVGTWFVSAGFGRRRWKAGLGYWVLPHPRHPLVGMAQDKWWFTRLDPPIAIEIIDDQHSGQSTSCVYSSMMFQRVA